MLMRECECSMIYIKRWCRILDRIFYGHSKHVCAEMMAFTMPHKGRHRCKCSKSFADILFEDEKENHEAARI